ncbi:hypothetical protein BD410DRAFT_779280 [Rickenella mellea]|uniref:Mediator of RNA polymerase II transcription subunit 13 n=1 Tax=Rickenella mellea TaxID=50990 RepID=A0A4R5XDF0_9AGAM|nr:hypothetical protein BD410DRAFT_779280 [Rickenella mellea]
MTSKGNIRRAGPTSPLSNTDSNHHPPVISGSSKLLASAISLAHNTRIAFAHFTPNHSVSASQSISDLEEARRNLLKQNNDLSLLHSVLPAVCLAKEDLSLWIFSFADDEASLESCVESLSRLQFRNLSALSISHFNYDDLYPCSPNCSVLRDPCPACRDSLSQPATPVKNEPSPTPTGNSRAQLLPRKPLRLPYLMFLSAVRERLIDDICEASRTKGSRETKRLGNGFLLGPLKGECEWASGWGHHSGSRSLIHCYLSVSLYPQHILVQPHLRPTQFYPLYPSTRLIAGTPITLLPFSTPAYYLSCYSGPTTALTEQFKSSLEGLGAGDWMDDSKGSAQYVLAWVSVQNKQGEDKGIVVIWPGRLCVSLLSDTERTSACGRVPLPYIPELPSALQSSPVPSHPQARYPAEPASAISATSPAITPSSTTSPTTTDIPLPNVLPPDPPPRRRAVAKAEAIKSFHSLVANHSQPRDLRKVAVHVGGYVDAIAKERERERERIRRERDAIAQSPKAQTLHTPGPSLSQSSTELAPPKANENQTAVELPIDMETAQLQVPETQSAYATPPEDLKVKLEDSLPISETTPPLIGNATAPSQIPAQVGSTFDAFRPIDSTWSQNADFIMDLNFDMNVTAAPMPDGIPSGNPMDVDMDGFGVFTDDDFSFFDGPARPPATQTMRLDDTLELSTGLTPAAGPAPFGLSSPAYGDMAHISGPGPPSATPGAIGASPWVSGILSEGCGTPKLINFHAHEGDIQAAPELVPASPAKSTSTNDDIPTPAVHLLAEAEIFESPMAQAFTSIPFAEIHRLADEKYVLGKFAMPSPPDSMDAINTDNLQQSTRWQQKYASATDPRVGVVRKLIGCKRKSDDVPLREHVRFPSWSSEYDEWSKTSESDDMNPEPESDDDDDPWIEEDDAVISRPSTPSPSYLPLGPSLLATRFLHSELLPLSSNLRPPGIFEVVDTPVAATLSVPTPVSPAAALGAACERSKSLEAAAQILGKEIVDNGLWAEGWKMSTAEPAHSISKNDTSWNLDVQHVTSLLQELPLLETLLDLEGTLRILNCSGQSTSKMDTTSEAPLAPLKPPLLSVGRSNAAIQVLPSAVRFWDKLGLSPRSGSKNVNAFVLFEGEDENREKEIERWLRNVSTSYTAKGFGLHTPGKSNQCNTDGLIPLKFESFRKTLSTFMPSISSQNHNIVFYIITPSSIMSLSSQVLRQIFSGVKRTLKSCGDQSIYFQFVTEIFVTAAVENPSTQKGDMEQFVHSVYDRILRPIDRFMSPQFFVSGEQIRKPFEAPAIAIARPLPGKVSLVVQNALPDQDVIDRHTLLHIGYRISACGNWILAASIDERGEAHDIAVWLTQPDDKEAHIVSQLWTFAVQFMRDAHVEWRVVFAKLGVLGEQELNAWISHLSADVLSDAMFPAVHVSLVCVEEDNQWTFVNASNPPNPTYQKPTSPSDRMGQGSFFAESSSETYTLHSLIRCPLIPACDKDIGTDHSHIPDDEDISPCDAIPLRPLHTSSLVRVPASTDSSLIWTTFVHMMYTWEAPSSTLTKTDRETHHDIVQNYHDLAVLAQARWRLQANPNLPFHLAALQIMHDAIGQSEGIVDP